MRDPTSNAAAAEKRVKEAVKDARARLRLLAAPALAWSVTAWHDSNTSRDPRDEFQAAVGFVDALLNDEAADSLLGVHASLVRSDILPALWRGRPPKKKGRRAGHLRERWIAAVVAVISRQYGLNPTRNPASDQACGCSIVAKALDQLEIKLSEKSVAGIWTKYGHQT